MGERIHRAKSGHGAERSAPGSPAISVRAARQQVALAEHLGGAAGAVMDEMAVAIEQRPAVLALDDGMALPDLVEEGTGGGSHGAALSSIIRR